MPIQRTIEQKSPGQLMDWETSEEYMGAKRGGACPHVSCVKLQWAAYWQNPSQQRRRRTVSFFWVNTGSR